MPDFATKRAPSRPGRPVGDAASAIKALENASYGPEDADAIAYIHDLVRPLADLAASRRFEMLAYLLGMAALEAGEARARIALFKSARTDDPDAG